MAAKKKPTPPSPKPKPSGGMKRTNSIDLATAAIQRRYGNNVASAKTMKEAIQGLKDVVAESSLVDKYPKRTLDAASTRVAQNAFQGLKRAEKYGKGRK